LCAWACGTGAPIPFCFNWRCVLHSAESGLCSAVGGVWTLHTRSMWVRSVVPELSSTDLQISDALELACGRGWVDPVSDPLLLRKSGNARNRTRYLLICSQELWPLDHRGGPSLSYACVYVFLCVYPRARAFVSAYYSISAFELVHRLSGNVAWTSCHWRPSQLCASECLRSATILWIRDTYFRVLKWSLIMRNLQFFNVNNDMPTVRFFLHLAFGLISVADELPKQALKFSSHKS
jgi:hypothetical protein